MTFNVNHQIHVEMVPFHASYGWLNASNYHFVSQSSQIQGLLLYILKMKRDYFVPE